MKFKEPDFSKVTFKVNAAGSWANLLTCGVERIGEVKAACLTLAKASGKGTQFKYVDAEGGTIEHCSYVMNGIHDYCWHEPARR